MRTGAHLDDGTVPWGIVPAVNDTLRIALIALVAVALFKLVAPKVPGLSSIAGYV